MARKKKKKRTKGEIRRQEGRKKRTARVRISNPCTLTLDVSVHGFHPLAPQQWLGLVRNAWLCI